jgi:hypothetical protein
LTPLVASWGWTELFIGVSTYCDHWQCGRACFGDYRGDEKPHGLGAPDFDRLCGADSDVCSAASCACEPLLPDVHMGLVFNTFELVAIIFSVFIVNSISEDGESNWFEGVQLLAAYAIIAVAFFFHP